MSSFNINCAVLSVNLRVVIVILIIKFLPLFFLRIIVDLLKMNVAPQAVFQTLKAMCAGQRVAESNGGEPTTVSQTTSITTAPAEPRGQYVQTVRQHEQCRKSQVLNYLQTLTDMCP